MTGSLTSLKEALVGLNVMSSDVENTFKHLKKNNVPEDFKVRLIQKYWSLLGSSELSKVYLSSELRLDDISYRRI